MLRVRFAVVLPVVALLAACGGESSAPVSVAPTQSLSLQLELPAPGSDVAEAAARPSFHAAPILLAEPGEADVADPQASAVLAPHAQRVPAEFARLSTRRLTFQQLAHVQRYGVALEQVDDDEVATPMATAKLVTTYTPAQIRAAYAMPALPAPGAAASTSQAAQLGAGQTIYIVDAQHDPNAAAELAAFNQKFGLPGCTSVAIATTATLPLAAAPTTGCTFSVVYATSTGARTATAPAYDAGWATEIAMDVQWSHATAPMARIILVEAPDAGVTSLTNAVTLANTMGPGIVSMSFGAPEGSWTSSYDAAFGAAKMTYLASAGDGGAAAEWPAVSARVLAIGGTSLTWTGSGGRSESAWSGTGGAVSAFVPTPAWQTSAVPGMGTPAHRAVSDVSFNADPATGQYVAVQPQGSTAVNWLSAGGTSVSAPQWAGLFAAANAQLAQRGLAPLGAPHAALYQKIATVAASYASSFGDVSSGNNGTCATCSAKVGYDLPTGLGTPTVSALLPALAGGAPVAPVVSGGAVAGTSGVSLSFQATVTAANALSYALGGAPAGMSISGTGLVTWQSPVAGSYSVTVNVVDLNTGLTGRGTYTVTIAAPLPPAVASASVTATAGSAFSYALSVTNANPVTWTISGGPSGMGVGTAGVLSWATPVAGSYKITASARDTKTGLSGSGTITLAVNPPPPPVVGSGSVSGNTSTALSFTVPVTSPNTVTWLLSGAPTGMVIGTTGVVSWPKPVVGKYTVTVKATDTKTGLSGQGSYTVAIAAAGPVITAGAFTGVAGKPMSGTIAITDATSNSLSISISGIPMGLNFTIAGTTLTGSWNSPVTGRYTLVVNVKDGNGLAATLNVPVTITAK